MNGGGGSSSNMSEGAGASSATAQAPLSDIISTAQNLVSMLTSSLGSAGSVRSARQGRGDSGGGQGEQAERAQSSRHGQSVQQEMARSFPGFFRKEVKGKRRFAPYTRPQKSFLVNVFLLDKQREKTPKGELELELMLAGLGKRSLTIGENITHPECLSEKKDFDLTVKFNHDCDIHHTVCFPTVSACTRTVTFPSAHLKTPEEFKNIMHLAMHHGESFDRV